MREPPFVQTTREGGKSLRFTFEKNELTTQGSAERNCWLLTNGLGGFASTSPVFSVTRCDQGLLIAAKSPSRRYTLVHRVRETLDGETPTPVSFTWEYGPEWVCEAGGARFTRRFGMTWGENTSAVTYEIENHSNTPRTLTLTPVFQMARKGEPPQEKLEVEVENGRVTANGLDVYVRSNGKASALPVHFETLRYPDDEKDGRRPTGLGFSCRAFSLTVPAGERGELEIVFSTEKTDRTGAEIVAETRERQRKLLEGSGFASPEARELARAADAFMAYRASTGGKTVIAGYPFFGDWGRDTMIALPGCALATGRFEDAKSILRTFIHYERDGLLPNYFPEGQEEPRYNSADAPLLFINGVWLTYEKTGDGDFVREAWPTMKKIVEAYKNGTRYAIIMDGDGLISAGEGLDQVTWMDVRVGDILPTPRHGKPVEINAYWYSDLRAMAKMAALTGESGERFDALAERVKRSFNEKFWMEEKGYLRDVLSGTRADTQLRCNQIWAVSMPFTMLPPERERRVVETVGRFLYTPFGLRTLSPEDPEFHPFYGGAQVDRDMAYHQGTVWPFPAGAYYLALLKVKGNTKEAAREVRRLLAGMPDILREGCVGQLPEIYDGLTPGPSKGCFAQAWSVGELLRVYEKLEEIEREGEHDA